MSSLRLVASIVVRGGLHVQSFGFRRYLPVGSPVESAREFDRWGIDEIALILLDDDPEANRKLVSEVSKAIAVPLAAVGGIRDISHARAYIAGGADKLGFNKSLVENTRLVHEAARLFGEQCVMASIDLVQVDDLAVRWDYWRKTASDLNAASWIREVESIGAGEILLNFPERDGVGSGMDLETIQAAVDCTDCQSWPLEASELQCMLPSVSRLPSHRESEWAIVWLISSRVFCFLKRRWRNLAPPCVPE